MANLGHVHALVEDRALRLLEAGAITRGKQEAKKGSVGFSCAARSALPRSMDAGERAAGDALRA